MTTITSHTFRPTFSFDAVPRGSRVAAELFTRLMRWLETPRAARSRELPPTADVAAVRELAYRLQDSDPGFSADLFAAAARHESEHD
jgi:hypothetical protein